MKSRTQARDDTVAAAEPNVWVLVIGACAFVVVVWLMLGWWLPVWLFGAVESPDAAAGMFGGVEALFSGLAFALLLIALYLQKTELGLQREELKQTRHELARTADAQEQTKQFLAAQVDIGRAAAQASAAAQLYEYYAGQVHRKERCFTEQEKQDLDLMRARRDDTFSCLEAAFAALLATSSDSSGAEADGGSMDSSDHSSVAGSADGL